MRTRLGFVRLLVMVCGMAGALPAATIYSQAPNLNSFDITDNRLADDFTLSKTFYITGIRFWYQAQFETDLSDVSYGVYQDNTGDPGTLLFSGSAAPVTSDQTDYFFATIGIPGTFLSAGTYWLELHAGASLTDNNSGLAIWWEASDFAGVPTAAFSDLGTIPDTPVNVIGYDHYAFQLTGPVDLPPAPEPSGLISTGLGVTALALVGARRRSAATRLK